MNTLVSAVTSVAVVLVAQGSAAGQVPLARVGSKTFYIIEGKDSVNWDEAVQTCEQAGLKVAVIENEAESDALTAASLERAKQDKQHYMWLGAIFQNDKWIWHATGKELSYENWRPDVKLKPAPENGESCGYISAEPQWGTWHCGSEGGLPVCQK